MRSSENANLVEEFYFWPETLEDLPSLDLFLDLVPNLLSLHLSSKLYGFPMGGLVSVFEARSAIRNVHLKQLSLSALAVATSQDDATLDPKFVQWLADLPVLTELALSEWYSYQPLMLVPVLGYRIRRLELDDNGFNGLDVTTPSTLTLVAACPSLEHLTIKSDSISPVTLRHVLPHVHHPLLSLEIHISRLSEPVDPFVLHFTSLRSLDLCGDRMVSSNLHINLSRLVFLENLTLWWMHSPESIKHLHLLLADGPFHLPNLKRLEVEYEEYGECIRRRFEPTAGSKIGWDWSDTKNVPGDTFWPHSYLSAVNLFEAASSRQVELTGTFFESARELEFLFLEVHNLAVGEAYFQKDLGDVSDNRRRVGSFGFSEPEIEIDEEERKDWELVKSEVVFKKSDWRKEESWFALSLVNRKDGRVMGEWNDADYAWAEKRG
jgi:hypothetical protein